MHYPIITEINTSVKNHIMQQLTKFEWNKTMFNACAGRLISKKPAKNQNIFRYFPVYGISNNFWMY